MSAPEFSPPPPTHPPKRLRLSRWSYLLIGLTGFALTLALLYFEEDWRGKRAWKNYKAQLKARGKVLDWSAYIPPPVPENQNVFEAPQMGCFIKGEPPNTLSEHVEHCQSMLGSRLKDSVRVAELRIAPKSTSTVVSNQSGVFDFDDPVGQAQARAALERAPGRWALGVQGPYAFVARPVDEIKPISVVLQSSRAVALTNLAKLLPNFEIQDSDDGSFTANLRGVTSADDYLALTDTLKPDFAILRQALERPYVRMESDYQKPFDTPIPNFVIMRRLAQILTQRAQCFLVLDRPEGAMAELTLLQELRRLLQKPPAGPPALLVTAMIDVAIEGVHLVAIKDGVRLQVWREPQLSVLVKQLGETDLLPGVKNAFNTEVAAVSHTFENTRAADMVSWPEHQRRSAIYDLLPRGWVDQNLVVYARIMELLIDSVESTSPRVVPHKIDQAGEVMFAAISRFSPYNFLARVAIPNMLKASQRATLNQTTINQAQIVCALERYRLAQGEYPTTLESLVPDYMSQIPRDLIGGQPPRYRRTEDGRFLLYSIGWSEKDHGGQAGADEMNGDWVWNCSPNN